MGILLALVLDGRSTRAKGFFHLGFFTHEVTNPPPKINFSLGNLFFSKPTMEKVHKAWLK